jgi:hypothetical protein
MSSREPLDRSVEFGVLSITGIQSVRVNWLNMSVIRVSVVVVIIVEVVVVIVVSEPLGFSKAYQEDHGEAQG